MSAYIHLGFAFCQADTHTLWEPLFDYQVTSYTHTPVCFLIIADIHLRYKQSTTHTLTHTYKENESGVIHTHTKTDRGL